MSAKRILTLIIFTLVIAATGSFITSCEDGRADSLQLVGRSQSWQNRLVPRGLVIVTHGWIEKGQGGWPEDMAVAIQRKVDADSWLCGYFDWSEGAKTLNATSAAKYARDIAGPRLAEELLKLNVDFNHIHLIAHSSGCWAVSEAAKIIAKKTKADIHLTFLDAYISVFWEEKSLGDIDAGADVKFWAEHYYTRDYTLGWTQRDLSNAHNVDITNLDSLLKDHNFPWQWYYATISGKYPEKSFCDDDEIFRIADGVEYGFTRSREADLNNWNRSPKLPIGNKAVKLKKQRG